jgi:hypothetical protein
MASVRTVNARALGPAEALAAVEAVDRFLDRPELPQGGLVGEPAAHAEAELGVQLAGVST